MGLFRKIAIFNKIGHKPTTQQLLKSSPLRRRIIVINLVVLFIPIFGFLWVDSYRQSLIDAEVFSLTNEAEIIAAALAESAVLDNNVENGIPFNLLISQQVLRRISFTSKARPRLWNMDGEMLISYSALTPKQVETRKLAKIGSFDELQENIERQVSRSLRKIAWAFSYVPDLPVESNIKPPLNITDYPEVRIALQGGTSVFLRRSKNKDYTLTISAAAPIKQYRRVYGAIQLLKDSRQIDLALEQIYRQIFIISLIALTIMMVLSFWLATTIAMPLNRLANAANRIRTNKDRKAQIPDLSKRQDEIGHLASNLRAMTESLWQRMEAIESFAADVAHELKNPLTSLQSAVETLNLTQNPEQKERLTKIIKQDIERLNRLITDISDASRLDAELLRATTETVEIKKLMQNVIELYQTTGHKDKQIKFQEIDETRKSEIFVAAHQNRLVQVIRNLITNAISFAPDQSTITLKMQLNGSNLIIEVIDEGPGIPDNALEKIFSRFYSERPKQEAFGNHSGLGLSISRQIVETYNGTLTAHNKTGEQTGAIFKITLPVMKVI